MVFQSNILASHSCTENHYSPNRKKMSKAIQFFNDSENVLITIPVSLLKHAAENNPETQMIVKDENAFADKVIFQLKNNLGSIESGLTGLNELLDKAMIAVLENGSECVDFKEIIHY